MVMKQRYTKSCPPNLYSLFISSAVGSPTVLKYCKCRARYQTAYEPLLASPFSFDFFFRLISGLTFVLRRKARPQKGPR